MVKIIQTKSIQLNTYIHPIRTHNDVSYILIFNLFLVLEIMTGFSKVAVFRQDMPPSGGYSPIPWSRLPSRRIPFWPFVSLWLASNIFGYFYHLSEKREYWRKGK